MTSSHKSRLVRAETIVLLFLCGCRAETGAPPLDDRAEDEDAVFLGEVGEEEALSSEENNPWKEGFGGAPGSETGESPSSLASDVPASTPPTMDPPDTDEGPNSEPSDAPPSKSGEPLDPASGTPSDGEPSPPPSPPELLLARYREGQGSDKLLTVRNLGEATTYDCRLDVYSNGNVEAWRSIVLPPQWEKDQEVVLCTTGAPEAPCEVSLGSSPFNGNDALVVSCGETVLDSVGQVGMDPGVGWVSSDESLSTLDSDLVRCEDQRDAEPNDPYVLDGLWVALQPFETPVEARAHCNELGGLGGASAQE